MSRKSGGRERDQEGKKREEGGRKREEGGRKREEGGRRKREEEGREIERRERKSRRKEVEEREGPHTCSSWVKYTGNLDCTAMESTLARCWQRSLHSCPSTAPSRQETQG